jgi:outer membrane biosynthesis protein TonB
MTTPWIRAQDRKRNLLAAASTACIYAIAIAVVWAAGLLTSTSLSDQVGTIIVDLGGTEGDWGDIPLGLPNAPDRPLDAEAGAAPLPAQGADEPPAPAPEAPVAKSAIPEPAAPAAPAPAPVKTTAPVKAPAPIKAAPPKAAAPTPKTAPSKTAKSIPEPNAKEPEPASPGPTEEEIAAQQQQAREAAIAKLTGGKASSTGAGANPSASSTTTKKFGSSGGTSGAPVASATGTGAGPGVAGGTGTATFKGVEMGNALSTTFGASQGTVGRNLYVPIYLFMPLPQSIDDSVFQAINQKETFKRIYQQSGATWTLKSPVPLQQRGDYWRMLEDGGYDPKSADYKIGKKLKPVTLEFAVGPIVKGSNSELVDVRLVQSSGSSEIDEAVIYGFRQSAFFNKTGNAVSGKFVHSF